MIRLFKGGIHPTGKKESTRKKPLMVPEDGPDIITLPIKSPNGASAIPIVCVGERVELGQMVAVVGERGSVPLYSGVSGVVRSIGHEPHPLWGWSEAIVIENDRQNTTQVYAQYPVPEELSQEQLIAIIQERGIVGMSRDVTPVYEKILASRGKIDTLIVNATECQPYLTSDYRLLSERNDVVMWGAQILAKTLGASEIVVAMQGDKLDALEGLEKTLGWDSETMRICTLPTCYPFGEESQVVRFVTGVEIPNGEGASYAHSVVFNIATVYAVGDGVVRANMPTHRAITVTGGAVVRPRNLWVPIGVSIDYLLKCVGGLRENPGVILIGGSMNGMPQTDLRVPILSSSGGLLALAKWELPKHLQGAKGSVKNAIYPCIRCGHCVTVCPTHLSPCQIYTKMEEDKGGLAKLHPQDCIGCGCCSYRCPAKLPLAQVVKEAGIYVVGAPMELKPERGVKIYEPETAPEEEGLEDVRVYPSTQPNHEEQVPEEVAPEVQPPVQTETPLEQPNKETEEGEL